MEEQVLKITFKDKGKSYSIYDLNKEINSVLQVASFAEAITSDTFLRNIIKPNSIYRFNHELIRHRLGRKVKIKEILHNSPTIVMIVISYKAAKLIMKYFDNDDNDDDNDLPPTLPYNREMLNDFMKAMELLIDIIDNISN